MMCVETGLCWHSRRLDSSSAKSLCAQACLASFANVTEASDLTQVAALFLEDHVVTAFQLCFWSNCTAPQLLLSTQSSTTFFPGHVFTVFVNTVAVCTSTSAAESLPHARVHSASMSGFRARGWQTTHLSMRMPLRPSSFSGNNASRGRRPASPARLLCCDLAQRQELAD